MVLDGKMKVKTNGCGWLLVIIIAGGATLLDLSLPLSPKPGEEGKHNLTLHFIPSILSSIRVTFWQRSSRP